jgi:hypothetical protein
MSLKSELKNLDDLENTRHNRVYGSGVERVEDRQERAAERGMPAIVQKLI